MKEFLSQRGVKWSEKMVDVDRTAAIEMIRRSGQRGVPVTVIGDHVVVGFDKPKLERILNEMQKGGHTPKPGRRSLGARVADAGNYALPGGAQVPGAYVGGVHLGSPAEVAGIRAGDVITAVDGRSIGSVQDLTQALASNSGDRTKLTIRRGPGSRDVEVVF